MQEAFIRTEMLLGREAMKKLAGSRVAVFGLGGVGGHALDALVRSGIGAVDLIDGDRFTPSNLNRQLLARANTLGQLKVDVAAEHIREINPDCRVRCFPLFFSAENAEKLRFSDYDYVLDAIDTVSSKLLIIKLAKAADVPVISAMGTGGKLDPAKLCISDISQTEICPLARVMRRECRKAGLEDVKAVWSREEPAAAMPASAAFVPPSAGILMAAEVVKDLCRDTGF